jgi:L,D-peptidoglycan transpeptidase YkuD (ErfK/YbiS/YcfS/YnhG family)
VKRIVFLLTFFCACSSNAPVRTPAPPTSAPLPSRTTAPPSPLASVATPSPAPPIVVPGARDARQAIVVRSASWTSTTATLDAFEKIGGSWRRIAGPLAAYVGTKGFTRDKREGDLRTPAGVYGFSFMFGTAPDPGARYRYRRSTRPDVWVDDPASRLYNTWQREPSNGRWASAERLYQPDAYRYAAAIAYNTARTPGRGSAIFLHVSVGNPTGGCVSVERASVVRLLRWLDPSRRPVIVMGPRSYVDAL